MNKTVLITGITGFLGSHLADFFIKQDYNVIGLKRSSSDTWRCKEHLEEIHWIDVDLEDWQNQVIQLTPKIIIHAAWGGVASNYRNDLRQQLKNLELIADLLFIAKEIQLEQFIGFGSQAEYGQLDEIVSEDQNLNPHTAYGIVKVTASILIDQYCRLHNINWYWLRVFSVFGERESEQSLIPSVIKKLYLNESELKFSSCNQKYAYMYIDDFTKAIFAIVDKTPVAESGIYNISAQGAISLRIIVEKIKEYSGNKNSVFHFGALPLRPGQSMHIEGTMTKFSTNIKVLEFSKIEMCLKHTVDFYLHELKHNLIQHN